MKRLGKLGIEHVVSLGVTGLLSHGTTRWPKYKEGQGMGGMRTKGGWALGSVQMLNEADSDILEGFACSPEQVTAEATVILSPDDFGR